MDMQSNSQIEKNVARSEKPKSIVLPRTSGVVIEFRHFSMFLSSSDGKFAFIGGEIRWLKVAEWWLGRSLPTSVRQNPGNRMRRKT